MKLLIVYLLINCSNLSLSYGEEKPTQNPVAVEVKWRLWNESPHRNMPKDEEILKNIMKKQLDLDQPKVVKKQYIIGEELVVGLDIANSI